MTDSIVVEKGTYNEVVWDDSASRYAQTGKVVNIATSMEGTPVAEEATDIQK